MPINLDNMDKDDAAERARRDGYRSYYYTGEVCRNCSRNRVMRCDNGKRICEKCGWDADANMFDIYYTGA